MSWFGWGGSSEKTSHSTLETPSTPIDLTDGGGGVSFSIDDHASQCSVQANSPFSTPVLALDQIKSAGVPVTRQMTPYLQMDPSMFISSQPQYIMPDGGTGTSGKGKFEFALGHIGWAVGSGFAVGSIRGALGELLNPETRKLVTGKPWMTRMVNATVKHGSGYAQPAGAVVFMYSALEIALRSVRAEDELNCLGAGALTGAIYRSPYGLRASGIGAFVGIALAAAWTIANPDSRQRISEIFA
ncbi:unnamed protein product [Angiostrongylus costaricensis]|uniref:Mitochondrial import inner membrane translocase subunit TIM23 n=1 Tax=Angiostrongylus costaricensis TaxID=334426 RepID=A0A0R3PVK5_ANGCS|nr:unnamed protein product [Angiostrongylus costaricensis]